MPVIRINPRRVNRRGLAYGLGRLGDTSSAASIQQMIVNAANSYGVPPALALGIASHESGFNPNATNVNTNGTTDYGVMQLNSTTVQTLGVQNPYDPQENIDAGVGLLASYLQKYNGNTTDALWAYASGSGAVSAGGTPNSTAQGFISYVQSYTPPASLDLSTTADSLALNTNSLDLTGSDSSSSDDGSDAGSSLGLSTVDWGTVGIVAAVAAIAYFAFVD